MLKLQVRRWSEGPRILVLMLAVMLPAVALIVFGVHHLRNIQRDKAIEAVIQREYQQVLAIAEKRIDERAYEVAEEARAKFPDADNAEELDMFFTTHPDIAHAFLWKGKGSIEFRSQAEPDAKLPILFRKQNALIGFRNLVGHGGRRLHRQIEED